MGRNVRLPSLLVNDGQPDLLFVYRLQVNDLSCTLLTILLLPLILKTSELTKSAAYRPRIVVTASETHFWVTPSKEELVSPHILEKFNDPEYCKSATVIENRYLLSKRT
jgi:retinol dehydrogenase 12